MSYETVSKFLIENGAGDGIKVFDVSSATVELAAEAIGCANEQIAKSISVKLSGKGALIVCSGDMKLDNQKFKAEFNEKASMIPYAEVKDMIGHDVGGVCPFCLNPDVKVYLDSSLKRFDIVYTAAGSDNSVVGLTPEKLESLSSAERWVDVCKPR